MVSFLCMIFCPERGYRVLSERSVDSLKAGKDTILLTNTAYDRSELELSFEAGEALGLGL